jgi:hypothetical protein
VGSLGIIQYRSKLGKWYLACNCTRWELWVTVVARQGHGWREKMQTLPKVTNLGSQNPETVGGSHISQFVIAVMEVSGTPVAPKTDANFYSA